MNCAQCNQPIVEGEKVASQVGIGAFYHEICWEQADEAGQETDCSICGGEGWQESDDPLWEGFDDVPCKACNGTGLRRHQHVF